eukprot:Skav226818  [mRNA]  locus=scaffold606:55260:60121:- [translate_table: standard]
MKFANMNQDMEDIEKNETKSITEGPPQPSYGGAEVTEPEDSDRTWTASGASRLLPKKIPKGGFPHLDITRIVCVMLLGTASDVALYAVETPRPPARLRKGGWSMLP